MYNMAVDYCVSNPKIYLVRFEADVSHFVDLFHIWCSDVNIIISVQTICWVCWQHTIGVVIPFFHVWLSVVHI